MKPSSLIDKLESRQKDVPHMNLGEEVVGDISHEVAYEIELYPDFLRDCCLPLEAVSHEEAAKLMRKIAGSNQTEVSNDLVFSLFPGAKS